VLSLINITRVLLIIFCLILSASIAHAERFGNIAVFADETLEINLENVKLRLESSRIDNHFDDNGTAILWNLYPGGKSIQVVFPDDRKNISLFVVVYPGLTSKINLISDNDRLKLVSDGFADQGGHILTFDRATLNALPGEPGDGIGLISGNYIDSTKFSYDGLSLTESSLGRSFDLQGKNYFDYAIVNISDPFAGYDGADVSMISNFEGPDVIGVEGIYGSRDQKRYRIAAAKALPRNIGSFYGALSYDDLGDASPRWNVVDVLPHNDAENIELLAGAGLNINSRIKSDIRFIYKRNYRNYYRHSYHFNYIHSPHEELDFYNGISSINGWLTDKLFTRASFGVSGYDQKRGDGVYFDDLESYIRPDGNPNFDESGLFMSWDDIDSVTADIDEGHVWSDYERIKRNSKRIELNGLFKATNQLAAFVDFEYLMEDYRYYRNLFPENPNSSSILDIGFDSAGVNTTDSNDFGDIPKPKTLNLTLGLKHTSRNFSVKGAFDLVSFNPSTKAFNDLTTPFVDNELSEDDLKDASVKTKLGYRLSFYFDLDGQNSASDFGVFAHAAKKYRVPDLNNLYMDYRFTEYKILNAGYYYPFGNPELSLYKYFTTEFGVKYRFENHNMSLSASFNESESEAKVVNIPASPKAYQIYLNSSTYRYYLIRFTYSHVAESFFNPVIAANFIKGADSWKSSLNNIAWTLSEAPSMGGVYPDNYYEFSGAIVLRPSYLFSQDNGIVTNILSRCEFSAIGYLRTGLTDTPFGSDVDALTIFSISYAPVGAIGDHFDLNLGMSFSIIKNDNFVCNLKFDVLNALNRENVINVYPDGTAYLYTEPGQNWLDDQTTFDSSGLTRLEKYLLKVHDPNNFSRPRMFRASLSVLF